MSYGDRITGIQEQGKYIPKPPDSAYFGGRPSTNRVEPMSDEDKAILDRIDTSTPFGRFERIRRASEMAIRRYVIGQLEHQEDGAFVDHLQRLVIAQLDFVEGMRSYFAVKESTAVIDTNDSPYAKPVGRVFVGDARFMADFNEQKGLNP